MTAPLRTIPETQPLHVDDILHNPLNYTGGKAKLLSQILPFFPSNINRFYDVFGGAFTMGINVDAEHKIYNELDKNVFNTIEALSSNAPEENLLQVKNTISKYNLSDKNKLNLEQLLYDFNNSSDKPWYMFYSIIANSFKHTFKYDSKGNLKVDYGDHNFNPSLENKFIDYSEHLFSTKNISYRNGDYSFIKNVNIVKDDFFYFDPPYLITDVGYCKHWNEQAEIKFLDTLIDLDKRGAKFALSNVFETKGYTNQILKDWVQAHNYNIIYLDKEYNFHHSHKSSATTVEVLITNYGSSHAVEMSKMLATSNSIIQGQVIDTNIVTRISSNIQLAIDEDKASSYFQEKSSEARVQSIKYRFDVARDLRILKDECKGIKGLYSKRIKDTGLSMNEAQEHLKLVNDHRVASLSDEQLKQLKNLTYSKLRNMTKLTDEEFNTVLEGNDQPLKDMKKSKNTKANKVPDHTTPKSSDSVTEKEPIPAQSENTPIGEEQSSNEDMSSTEVTMDTLISENNNLKDALEKAQKIIKAQQKEIAELSLNQRVPSMATPVNSEVDTFKQSA